MIVFGKLFRRKDTRAEIFVSALVRIIVTARNATCDKREFAPGKMIFQIRF